jgi:hypothetical protein
MTTIPNLNIVIQQGDIARESQNVKNHGLEASQRAAAERLEWEDKKRTEVPEAEETEKTLFNKEKSGEGKRKPDQRGERKQKEKKDADPDSPGRLLDTLV